MGEPFEARHSELVAPAHLADGTEVIVKVQLPDDVESVHEADVLGFWNGHGAVRLLAHDPEHRALLLERCRPGTSLWEVPEEEALAIGAEVLRRLWRPAPDEHPYRLLADEAVRWAEELPHEWEVLGRPVERSVIDQALTALRDLPPTQEELVVCHQDFQGSNVLRAEREPWLAIDPKPMVGERAFDTASFLRDRRWGLTAETVRRRLDRLSAELELDRERMRLWGLAHTLAWSGLEDEGMTAAARFLAEA
jgi:streptomycin 6-kinase